jgi:hypothetical protein
MTFDYAFKKPPRMRFQMYFPQSNASSGFEALREIKKRDSHTKDSQRERVESPNT